MYSLSVPWVRLLHALEAEDGERADADCDGGGEKGVGFVDGGVDGVGTRSLSNEKGVSSRSGGYATGGRH
jgi:hypothetical protein